MVPLENFVILFYLRDWPKSFDDKLVSKFYFAKISRNTTKTIMLLLRKQCLTIIHYKKIDTFTVNHFLQPLM